MDMPLRKLIFKWISKKAQPIIWKWSVVELKSKLKSLIIFGVRRSLNYKKLQYFYYKFENKFQKVLRKQESHTITNLHKQVY